MYSYPRRSYRRTRRRPYARRSSNRRRYRRRVPRRLSDATVYRFKRKIQLANINSNALGTYGAINFSLSQLNNPTEFTSLFDSFKITGAKVTFMPRITESTGVVGSNGLGTFVYNADYDDSTAPTTQVELLERQSSRMKAIGGTRPFSIFVRPSAGATLVGGFGQTKGWSDTANTGILYYGVKYAWVNVTTTSTMDCYCTYYLKFKGVK